LKKTILITGANGFIGGYIKNIFSEKYNIIALSREKGFDITHMDSLMTIEKDIDILIHTAAVTSNNYSIAFENNVIGTYNLCKFAKEKKIKHFILISTLSVYNEKDNEYYDNYGKTKKNSEEVAYNFCQENGIKLTILRLAQVYDDKRVAIKNQAMLYGFIDRIQKEHKIKIFGTKNPLRNYIHIDYVCNVIKEVVLEEKIGLWNVIENKSHTISEIAYMIFDALKQKPKIFYDENHPDIHSVHIPSEKIYDSKQFCSIPLQEGIKRILIENK